MQEKAMVSDALNTLNSGLKTYSDMISQTENQQLRSTLQQMRNETETSQYELYTIAKNKNYYQPAGQASQNEINSLKSVFASNTGWAGTSNTVGKSGVGNTTTGNVGNVGNVGKTGSSTMTGSSGGIGSTGL